MSFALNCRRMSVICCILTHCLFVPTVYGGTIQHDQLLVAEQHVNLLGVDAILVARGIGSFSFEVDANNNSTTGSTIDTLFVGFLPAEFAALGAAGAPFELFSLDPETVTVTGNGTHVKIETLFGLRVFVAPGVVGANFYTSVPSVFETDVVSLTDFTGSVFQSPDRPNDPTSIFIGDNLFGLPSGIEVGVSYDRTVSAVPEPSTFALFACALLSLTLFKRKNKARAVAY